MPFHFGPSEQPLFGVYHASESGSVPSQGVLICYPLGHEYQRTHRLFRQLASQLAGAGVPTLRFDYAGTGDSAGETGSGTPALWRENIRNAMDELRDLSAVQRISAVGSRLGAALAATVGDDRDFDTLVLWDPIVSGRAFISRLEAMHGEILRREHPGAPWTEQERTEELLGFAASPGVRAQIGEIDLLGLERFPGRKMVVIASEQPDSHTALCRHLAQLAQEHAFFHEPAQTNWDDRFRYNAAVTAPAPLERILSVLATPR